MAPANEELNHLLGRLAAGIDDVIDAEMSSALVTVGDRGTLLSGDLKDVALPLLMGRFFCEGTTGRLKIQQEPIEKDIYFEAGLPVMAASTDTMDRMLAMLVRERVVSQPQKQEVEKIVDATGRKVGSVLVQLSLLRSDELLPAVRRHYESVILSLFSWTAGRWQLEPGVTAGPDRTRLLRHPAAIVREGLATGFSPDLIAAHLGAGKSLLVFDSTGAAADVVSHMLTDATEARIPPLFDSMRSIDDVARASGLPDMTVWQVAYALSCFGLLHPVQPGRPQPRSRVDVRDQQIARERVEMRYALAKESDYFQFLGIDRRADAGEIKRVCRLLLKEVSPEMLGPELAYELRQPIEMIRDVLEEAVRVLGVPALRAAYEQNLLPTSGSPVTRAEDGPNLSGEG